jgi:hypothetical protein
MVMVYSFSGVYNVTYGMTFFNVYLLVVNNFQLGYMNLVLNAWICNHVCVIDIILFGSLEVLLF